MVRWIILVVVATSLVSAEQNSFVWIPTETTASWDNPDSWSLGRVPNKYDDVTINAGSHILALSQGTGQTSDCILAQ